VSGHVTYGPVADGAHGAVLDTAKQGREPTRGVIEGVEQGAETGRRNAHGLPFGTLETIVGIVDVSTLSLGEFVDEV
jgi:hypothetical protein